MSAEHPTHPIETTNLLFWFLATGKQNVVPAAGVVALQNRDEKKEEAL